MSRPQAPLVFSRWAAVLRTVKNVLQLQSNEKSIFDHAVDIYGLEVSSKPPLLKFPVSVWFSVVR